MPNPLLSAVNDNIFSGATQQRTSGVVDTGFSNILDRMSLISFVIPFILYTLPYCTLYCSARMVVVIRVKNRTEEC